jgi:hypothetical protein
VVNEKDPSPDPVGQEPLLVPQDGHIEGMKAGLGLETSIQWSQMETTPIGP